MAWPPLLLFFPLFTLLQFYRTPQAMRYFEKEETPQKHLPAHPTVLEKRKLRRTAFIKENGRAQIHARPPLVYTLQNAIPNPVASPFSSRESKQRTIRQEHNPQQKTNGKAHNKTARVDGEAKSCGMCLR